MAPVSSWWAWPWQAAVTTFRSIRGATRWQGRGRVTGQPTHTWMLLLRRRPAAGISRLGPTVSNQVHRLPSKYRPTRGLAPPRPGLYCTATPLAAPRPATLSENHLAAAKPRSTGSSAPYWVSVVQHPKCQPSFLVEGAG